MSKKFHFSLIEMIELKNTLQRWNADVSVESAISRLEKVANRYSEKVIQGGASPECMERQQELDRVAYRAEELCWAINGLSEADARRLRNLSSIDEEFVVKIEQIHDSAEYLASRALNRFWRKGRAGDRELAKLIWNTAAE